MVLGFDSGSVPGVDHQWLSQGARQTARDPIHPASQAVCLWSPPSTPDRLPETFGHLAQKFDVVEQDGDQEKCPAGGDRSNPTCEA